MHPNLYLSVEYRPKGARPWALLLRLGDTGAAPTLHGLLGAIQRGIKPSPIVPVRGLPPDVTDQAIGEDAFTIDDAAAAMSIGEVLDDVRFCTREAAEDWERRGLATIFDGRQKVTDPDAYGHSWLTDEEFRELAARAAGLGSEKLPVLRTIAAAMAQLETEGFESRVVYWFE